MRKAPSLKGKYFRLKGSDIKELMKHNLYRIRMAQTMCVVALYGPNCNGAKPVCMGSGSWNMGF